MSRYGVTQPKQFIGTDYPWAVIDMDDGSVADRYATEAEAREALPGYYDVTLSSYTYTVTVVAATPEQAQQVMNERIGPDEDYGFAYTIDWDWTAS